MVKSIEHHSEKQGCSGLAVVHVERKVLILSQDFLTPLCPTDWNVLDLLKEYCIKGLSISVIIFNAITANGFCVYEVVAFEKREFQLTTKAK
jgi:hypothetical protein